MATVSVLPFGNILTRQGRTVVGKHRPGLGRGMLSMALAVLRRRVETMGGFV